MFPNSPSLLSGWRFDDDRSRCYDGSGAADVLDDGMLPVRYFFDDGRVHSCLFVLKMIMTVTPILMVLPSWPGLDGWFSTMAFWLG